MHGIILRITVILFNTAVIQNKPINKIIFPFSKQRLLKELSTPGKILLFITNSQNPTLKYYNFPFNVLAWFSHFIK